MPPALPLPANPRWLSHGPWAYWFDFAFYGVACAALATALMAFGGSPWLGLWVLAGGAVWTGLEYALHRWVLHGMAPFKAWHAAHHRVPTARVGAPTWLSAGLFVLGLGAPVALWRGALPALAWLRCDGRWCMAVSW